MKTDVFLKEDKKFKSIRINNINKDIIDDDLRKKWQRVLNIIADIMDVSVLLIMKVTEVL